MTPLSKNSPVVSICLPTLNARRFLEPRMDSILSQTLTDWELIVCDSYSDDGTWEYLRQFKDDPRGHLHQVPKEGLYAGWNECLKRCRGEYVYIATADDTMVPECLERMVAALEAAKTTDCRLQTADKAAQAEIDVEDGSAHVYSSQRMTTQEDDKKGEESKSLLSAVCGLRSDRRPVDLCVCRHDRIDETGCVLKHNVQDVERFYGRWLEQPHVRSGWLEFLVVTGIACHWDTVTAMLFRRSLLDKVGLFRTDLGNAADRIWRWKALLYSDVAYLPEHLATWRMHKSQATAQKGGRSSRWLHDQLIRFLDDNANQFPDEWRKNRLWQEKLCHHFCKEHYVSYGLNYKVLKEKPLKFAEGLAHAAFCDFHYCMHRLANGFSWHDDWLEDEVVFIQKLCEEWSIDGTVWPLCLN